VVAVITSDTACGQRPWQWRSMVYRLRVDLRKWLLSAEPVVALGLVGIGTTRLPDRNDQCRARLRGRVRIAATGHYVVHIALGTKQTRCLPVWTPAFWAF
jgi:hypothetical protein